ncbi:MAG: DUF6562 domain-containing protein [Rikenellaceae bacterium]
MRKITLIMTVVFLLLMASCQKTATSINSAKDVIITAAISGDGVTRALDDYGDGGNVTRCVLEVYDSTGEKYARIVEPYDVECNSAIFSLRLVTTQNYEVVVWADCGGGEDFLEDKYYTTIDGLTQVKIISHIGNNDELDAFYAMRELAIDNTSDFSMVLTRPLGQLSVMTKLTDVELDSMTPDSVNITYSATIPTTFNALNGESDTSSRTSATWSAKVADAVVDLDGYMHLLTDYIFANDTDMLTSFSVDFVNANGDIITTNSNFSQIPIHRNMRTIVKGELLTKESEILVSLDPTFEDGEE